MLTPAQYHIYPRLLILFAVMLSTHLPNRTPTSSSTVQAHQESVPGVSLPILVGYYSHIKGLFWATVPEVLLLGPLLGWDNFKKSSLAMRCALSIFIIYQLYRHTDFTLLMCSKPKQFFMLSCCFCLCSQQRQIQMHLSSTPPCYSRGEESSG